jgi:hypothetical protein
MNVRKSRTQPFPHPIVVPFLRWSQKCGPFFMEVPEYRLLCRRQASIGWFSSTLLLRTQQQGNAIPICDITKGSIALIIASIHTGPKGETRSETSVPGVGVNHRRVLTHN